MIQAEGRTRIDEAQRYPTFKVVVSLLAKIQPPGDHSSQQIRRWAVRENLLPHVERAH